MSMPAYAHGYVCRVCLYRQVSNTSTSSRLSCALLQSCCTAVRPIAVLVLELIIAEVP